MAQFVEIATRDPERALPTLEEYFPGVRMSNPHGNFALELIASEVETFSIIKYRLQAPASSSSADFSDSLSFGNVDVGAMGLVTMNDRIDTTQSWRFPEERVHADWDDVTITALTISKSAALQMARAQVGSDSANLTFMGTAPIDTSRGQQWNAFVDYTRKAMTSDISALDSPLVRTSAFAHLMSLLLETFPNTMIDAARQKSRPTTTPSSVRRALEFIEQNAHLPINVEDIARESRMSIRALQYAFQRHLNTSPAAYLRRTRLDGAHRDLLRADPTAGATVLAIAMNWGFAHPGRFATYYREAYGVSPKQTLDS
jgi:AraC-like DNA-binding protein